MMIGLGLSLTVQELGPTVLTYNQARREGGGKGGKVFPGPAPRRLGAPLSLKNTEKGVPDGFFLT